MHLLQLTEKEWSRLPELFKEIVRVDKWIEIEQKTCVVDFKKAIQLRQHRRLLSQTAAEYCRRKGTDT